MATITIRPIRKAFTLMEMLVVMTIIVLLATMTYLFLPSMGQRNMATAADRISAWLLIAKQQAKRDGRPTGVRFYADPTNPPPALPPSAPGNYQNCLNFIQMIYVQQPDDITIMDTGASPPQYTSITSPQASTLAVFPNKKLLSPTYNNNMIVGFSPTVPTGSPPGTPQGALLQGSAGYVGQASSSNTSSSSNLTDAPVQIGDYIEFNRGGAVYQIAEIILGNDTRLNDPGTSKIDSTMDFLRLASPAPTLNSGGTTSYRIFRQPRPLLGEESLTLPDGVAIFQPIQNNSNNPPLPSGGNANIPQRPAGFFEILFSPSGNVIGQGLGSDQVYIWIYDTNISGSDTPFTGLPTTGQPPLIIAIQTRTGLIGTYPVDPNNPNTGVDPYQFARKGRSSGM